MGGGGQKGTSTVVTQPQPPQIAPEFQPFAQQVGQRATQHLDEFNLSDYSGNLALQVPGITGMQEAALDRIQQRFAGGIPTPAAEQQINNLMPWVNQVSQQQVGLQPNESSALNFASALPGYASQQVPVDPLRMFQYGQTQSVNQDVSTTNPWENAGVGGLSQFASGDLGNSPAVQAAMQAIAASVTPQVQNKMAAAGLGRSGAMLQELQNAQIGALLPVVQQGMQQQQSAANQLAGIGSGVAQRQMGMQNLLGNMANTIGGASETLGSQALARGSDALKSTIGTFADIGKQEAEREGETINRQLAAASQQYNPLLQLGESQEGRDTQALNEMIQGGALDRDIAGQIAQAQHADVLRRQALAEVFHTAMLGSIPSLTTFPSTSTETTKTPSTK